MSCALFITCSCALVRALTWLELNAFAEFVERLVMVAAESDAISAVSSVPRLAVLKALICVAERDLAWAVVSAWSLSVLRLANCVLVKP